MGMDLYAPVFPVVPSYTESGEIDPSAIAKYVGYLEAEGATTVMTTSGTSQFNLMSVDEVLALNACVKRAFKGRCILGLPTLGEIHLKLAIEETLAQGTNIALLLTYPDRFYSLDETAAFFARIAQRTPGSGLFLHGLPLHAAVGGARDYDAALLEEIIGASGASGMKEECTSYERGFQLCASQAHRPEFEFIVAGGSMRRMLSLQAAGAQRFLAGVGSLFPDIEIAFGNHLRHQRLREASLIIAELETPLFEVFMQMGWHKALRFAAKRLGLASGPERAPMREPTPEEAVRLEAALLSLERRRQSFGGLVGR